MKKIVLFILLMLPVVVFGQISWFDKPGDKVFGPFKVVQTLSSYEAHVNMSSSYGNYYGSRCLLWNNPKKFVLFDEAIIREPKKMEFRIVGTYRYITREGHEKTIPVIQIMEKQKKSKKMDKKHNSDDL